MFEKKKNFTFCMYEKLHKRLTKFAKKEGYRSLSEFFAALGQQAYDAARKKKGDKRDD